MQFRDMGREYQWNGENRKPYLNCVLLIVFYSYGTKLELNCHFWTQILLGAIKTRRVTSSFYEL